MQASRREVKPEWRWLRLVAGTAAVVRLAALAFYPPVQYSDSASYWRLAGAVHAGWGNYDGTRTPGYPVFLALAGSNNGAYGLQLLLGFLMTLGLFFLGWKLSGSPAFGAAIGLVHTLNPQQVFFEANILSESLATFLVFACMLGVFLWMRSGANRRAVLALGVGITASLAALTRPLFFFLPVWLALWLGLAHPGSLRKPQVGTILRILAPCLLLVGGWVLFIYNHFGVISLSTMNGYHMVQHTGAFFEYVPDEYKDIRDIYIKYRDQRIAEYGTQGNTIWDAIPELEQVSGLNFYDLSRTMAKISIDLIRAHPGLYLRSAASGWVMFWRAPVYWSGGETGSSTARQALEIYKRIIEGGLAVINLAFLVTSILALVSGRLRTAWKILPFLTLIASTIWLTSIVQTLLDHGDNPRFLVPLQSLVVLWVLWIAWQSWHFLRRSGVQ